MEELQVSRPRPPRPCQITFIGMDPSEAGRVEVRAWLDRLGALTLPMTGGQVVIEAIDEGRREERRYHVRMQLTMPNGVVIVGPEHPTNGAHEDVYVAIRNAFRAARRQLEAFVEEHPPELAVPPELPPPLVEPLAGPTTEP
jgi:ribosome-associated translation inhibitor RaiA